MKLVKYVNFIRESREDIDSICKKYGIENYTINEDGTVDVDGDVSIRGKIVKDRFVNIDLTKLPLRFGKVSGKMDISFTNLTSLSGAPREVGGNFSCYNNRLTSLEGSPISVGGDFSCSNNKLTSLKGSPISVGGDFYCNYNELKTLEGISQEIRGRLIDCGHNSLRNVRGIKSGWKGEFVLYGNPVYEIFDLFKYDEVEYDEVVELLNEYDVIKEEGVNIQSLEQVFIDMDMEFSFFKNYKTIL